VADDVRHLHAARPIKDRNPLRARIPWFHGDPGVQFAVTVDHLAFGVDYEAGVPRHTEWVGFHDGEATPDGVLYAGFFEGGDFGAIERAHEFGVGEHGEAVEAVFGEYNHVHLGVGFLGFCHEGADMVGGGLEV